MIAPFLHSSYAKASRFVKAARTAVNLLTPLLLIGATPLALAQSTDELSQKGDYDAELDAGSSPIPDDKADTMVDTDEAAPRISPESPIKKKKPLTERDFGRTIEEVEPFDPYRHMLMANVGLVSNFNAQDQLTRYTGAGVRYGFKLAHLILFRSSSTQDSLFIETGAMFYKVVGYVTPSDAYSVVAGHVSGRYTILLSRDFGFFGYFGTHRNFAFAAAEGQETALENLGSILPAFGGGLLFGIGPNWEARLDFGIDVVGLGVMLRF